MHKPGLKISYNRLDLGNRLAGDQIKKVLPNLPLEDHKLLNGQFGIPQNIINKYYKYLLECDFWRYKGTGLCGITGWANWKASYFPIFDRMGIKHNIMPSADLHKLSVSTNSILMEGFHNYCKRQHPHHLKLAIAGDPTAITYAVSGGSGDYVALAAARFNAIKEALSGVNLSDGIPSEGKAQRVLTDSSLHNDKVITVSSQTNSNIPIGHGYFFNLYYGD
jgi:hypothetical protein